jgi:hypothetical protein
VDHVVRLFIRQHERSDLLVPTKGFGWSATRAPISEYRPSQGEKKGDSWILNKAGTDRLRLLKFDANHYKTRMASMLVRPPGARGGVWLYGSRPLEHELVSLHLTAETSMQVTARGNTIDVWACRPDRDNHLGDTLVGNCVAASLEGLSPLAALAGKPVERQKRARLSFSAMQQAARGRMA